MRTPRRVVRRPRLARRSGCQLPGVEGLEERAIAGSLMLFQAESSLIPSLTLGTHRPGSLRKGHAATSQTSPRARARLVVARVARASAYPTAHGADLGRHPSGDPGGPGTPARRASSPGSLDGARCRAGPDGLRGKFPDDQPVCSEWPRLGTRGPNVRRLGRSTDLIPDLSPFGRPGRCLVGFGESHAPAAHRRRGIVQPYPDWPRRCKGDALGSIAGGCANGPSPSSQPGGADSAVGDVTSAGANVPTSSDPAPSVSAGTLSAPGDGGESPASIADPGPLDASIATADTVPAATVAGTQTADSAPPAAVTAAQASTVSTVTSGPAATFSDLSGWTIDESGGTPTGRGTVTAQDGEAVLREGDSFVVALKRTFTVPATPSSLSFTYDHLAFDTTAADSIKDAFEAALVDSQGHTLVHAFRTDRDAFFNISEDQPAALGARRRSRSHRHARPFRHHPRDPRPCPRLVNNDSDVDLRQDRLRRLPGAQQSAHDDHRLGQRHGARRAGRRSLPDRPADQRRHRHGDREAPRTRRSPTRRAGGRRPFHDITTSLGSDDHYLQPRPLARRSHRITARATDTAGRLLNPSRLPVNQPPVADAGGRSGRQRGGHVLVFDASASTDPRPSVRLSLDLRRRDHGRRPSSLEDLPPGRHHPVTLEVTDTAGSVAAATVHVTVANLPPLLDPIATGSSRSATRSASGSPSSIPASSTPTPPRSPGATVRPRGRRRRIRRRRDGLRQHAYSTPGFITRR